MAALTKEQKVELAARSCWLAGAPLVSLCCALSKGGAGPDDLIKALNIYTANDQALARALTHCTDRGAAWDRRRT